MSSSVAASWVKEKEAMSSLILNICKRLGKGCDPFDIPINDLEVFGSVVYWLCCPTRPPFVPGDIDIRIGIGECEPAQFNRALDLLCALSEGSDIEFSSWRASVGYHTGPGHSIIPLRKISLRIRESDGSRRDVNVDVVLANELPPPESSLTAWSMTPRNGCILRYRGNDAHGLSFDVFTRRACELTNGTHVTSWLANTNVSWDRLRYLMGRFAKLIDKGVEVSNPPFRVVKIKRDCPLCLVEKENHLVHPCGHTTCLECIPKVVQPRCPECRKDVIPHLPPDATLPEFAQKLIANVAEANARAL
jgi:hypothetical protein